MAGSITPYETAGRRYRVRYRKPDKSQTDKRGFRTKREAELFLASVTVLKARASIWGPNRGRKLLSAFHRAWAAERLAPLKPSSRQVMESAWRVHVEPKWAGREISGIKRSEIAEWVAELGKEKSAQTVRQIIFVLSAVLAIAARERAIPTNPAVGVARRSVASHRATSATRGSRRLRPATDGDTEQILIELVAYSGPRRGNAVAIRVRHLSMVRKQIRVEDNAVIVNGECKIGTPKSGEPRDIPIPPHLVKPIARRCERKGADAFVFGEGVDPIPLPARHQRMVHEGRQEGSGGLRIASRLPHPTISAIRPHRSQSPPERT